MMYCNTCGQCSHISDNNFYAYYSTFGWSRDLVNPDDCEEREGDDSEETDSDFDNYECPYCSGNDINEDIIVDKLYAKKQRAEYRIAKGELKLKVYNDLDLTGEWDT